MLRTRLWMGAVLVVLAVGVLAFDQHWLPWAPFLLLLLLGLSLAACWELVLLLRAADGANRTPPAWLCLISVGGVILANWIAHALPAEWGISRDPWRWVSGVLAASVLAAFLAEMATFREPGGSVRRIALTSFITAYLGVLPSFFAQLRWLDSGGADGISRGTLALALAIFVPKCGDIGAYFTGRLLGKHKMAPVLSPKKTWEGAAGAMVASVLAALGINALGPVLPNVGATVGFGLTVGATGLLGDLAESLIKRDCNVKDASRVMPGFGGVLDVVDAIIFAAPVAYWWLA